MSYSFSSLLFTLSFIMVSAVTSLFSQDQLAYLLNPEANTVTPLNLTARTQGTPIPVGEGPLNGAVTPDGQKAYVTCVGSAAVTPIIVATNTAQGSINVDDIPDDVVVSLDGKTAYVSIQTDTGILPIDTATNTLRQGITTGTGLYALCLSPDGSTLFASNIESPVLTVMNTSNQTVQTISGIPMAYDIAITPNGQSLYLLTGTSVVKVNAHSFVQEAEIPIDGHPTRIAITPDGQKAYVTNTSTNVVAQLNLTNNTIASEINMGLTSFDVAITSDGKTAYITCEDVNTRASFVNSIDIASNAIGTPLALNSLSSAIVLLNPSSITPKPPSHFVGRIKNKKHGHHRHAAYRMTTGWRASPTASVQRYDVYANGRKIGSISSDTNLNFRKYVHPLDFFRNWTIEQKFDFMVGKKMKWDCHEVRQSKRPRS